MKSIRTGIAPIDIAGHGQDSPFILNPPFNRGMPAAASCHSGCHEYRGLDFAEAVEAAMISTEIKPKRSSGFPGNREAGFRGGTRASTVTGMNSSRSMGGMCRASPRLLYAAGKGGQARRSPSGHGRTHVSLDGVGRVSE